MTLPTRKSGSIPSATVARLPVYHRVLSGLGAQGITTVSSEELARACGVTSAKLRKDLSHLGSYGTRGVGYDVTFLTYQIARELGITKSRGLVIVGVGNLGRALASYRAFADRGFHVVVLEDAVAAVNNVKHLAALEVIGSTAERRKTADLFPARRTFNATQEAL